MNLDERPTVKQRAIGEAFTGEIRVASRIIDYLSSGLYESPAACLKELVNNSYDADASIVQLYVKPDADRIIIEDDGAGMTQVEFETHFRRISESHKRDEGSWTKGERPKIGKIGIGFIAANEICDELEIFSTKKGSSELLHVNIDFAEMRKNPEDRLRQGAAYSKADYKGELLQCGREEHYTQLFLKSVRGEAKSILAGALTQAVNRPPSSLYGLNATSIRNRLARSEFNTWKDLDPYSETMLKIGLNVPVAYHKDWLPPTLLREAQPLALAAERLNFSVKYDGSELLKPIVFAAPDERCMLSLFNFEGEFVGAKGYFYAQHGTIKPMELHGLLVRIRNAAVGAYDSSFWEFSARESSLIQRWVSCEIWADDRLEDAMNIDRRTLRVAHPAYAELKLAIHSKLREVLRVARTQLYESGNTERKKARVRDAEQSIQEFALAIVKPISRQAARDLAQTWSHAESDRHVERALLKTYSLEEIYAAVVVAASGILNETQLEDLLRQLSRVLKR